LKEGGLIVVSSVNKRFSSPFSKNRPFCPFHVKEFTPEELLELIKLFFTSVALYGQFYMPKIWWEMRAFGDFLLRKLGLKLNQRQMLGKILSLRQYKRISFKLDEVDMYLRPNQIIPLSYSRDPAFTIVIGKK
jgi:hypothetical protein